MTVIGKHMYRDVPLDAGHGPYPVVVFIHGTSSFRIASGSVNAHWASRGFVVLAADYPGMFLGDLLCNTPGAEPTGCNGKCTASGAQDVAGDVKTQVDALNAGTGDLAFLSKHLDALTRLGISGHSQGACLAAGETVLPNVQIVIPMTGSVPVMAPTTASSLKQVMFIAGKDDTVIGYDSLLIGNWVCPPGSVSNMDAYTRSSGPPDVTKSIVGITGGGHLVPTDLCQTNAQGRNAIQEAKLDGVCGIDGAVLIGLTAIFDCGKIDMPDRWRGGGSRSAYASTAALEQTLMCKDRKAALDNMQTNVPVIGDYKHEP